MTLTFSVFPRAFFGSLKLHELAIFFLFSVAVQLTRSGRIGVFAVRSDGGNDNPVTVTRRRLPAFGFGGDTFVPMPLISGPPVSSE